MNKSCPVYTVQNSFFSKQKKNKIKNWCKENIKISEKVNYTELLNLVNQLRPVEDKDEYGRIEIIWDGKIKQNQIRLYKKTENQKRKERLSHVISERNKRTNKETQGLTNEQKNQYRWQLYNQILSAVDGNKELDENIKKSVPNPQQIWENRDQFRQMISNMPDVPMKRYIQLCVE